MQFNPLQIFVDTIWASPFWVKAMLVLLIVVRVGWPSLLTERATSPRRSRRRRWRRYRDD